MKKRLFMLLALTMAASLAACGAGASGEPQESQPGNSSSSASQPLTPAEPDTMPDSSQEPSKGNANSTLVAYFSATGNTEEIAQHLQTILGASLYEIIPAKPYSDDDLDYNASDCRANQEQNDPSVRPAIDGSVENMDSYDVILLATPSGGVRLPELSAPSWRATTLPERLSYPFAPAAPAA